MLGLNLICVTFTLAIVGANSTPKKCEFKREIGSKQFPANFSFGVSTAAYQIEGGWDADGKGPSIWDTFTHNHPEMMDDYSTADVGADSYHQFDQDLEALKELKVNFYRFSISWPRVLPTGDVSLKNQKGIDYYNEVINKLISNGIEPMVTMYHYDMPEELNKFGGFTNSIMIKYFQHYADFLFEAFGDRVKVWTTFNEPFDYCVPGYGNANYPPMVHAPGVADYLCMDTTLKAHTAAYHLYKSKYFDKQRGKIGITFNSKFFFSKTNNDEHVNRALHYGMGWLAHPIYSQSGGYPDVMVKDIENNSMKEGRPWSRLHPIKGKLLDRIKGTGDFLGLNYYTSNYVDEATSTLAAEPSWEYDSRLEYTKDPAWTRGKLDWLCCVPEGLEGVLKWIRDNYNNVEVFVTENGWADDGQLDDPERIDYIKAHLQAVLNAVNSGCNVTRYTYWSLIDNFEWQRGYTAKFGLYYVNTTSENKERIAKKSVQYYRNVIESKTLLDD